MGLLADHIRQAVRDGRYVFGAHANHRLRTRRIMGWQVVDGLEIARLLRERPKSAPNPAVEFEQTLADGTTIKAVWSWIQSDQIAKLVTIHFLED
jgi:hypothetical protein